MGERGAQVAPPISAPQLESTPNGMLTNPFIFAMILICQAQKTGIAQKNKFIWIW